MYRHLLVALDLGPESHQVVDRAAALLELTGSQTRITLMHVVEPLGFAYGGDIPLDVSELTDDLLQRARDQLVALCTRHRLLTGAHTEVRLGRPATEIHDYAASQEVDLVVVGSHGRSGLQLLLGSTANSVLHGARCDVLAVRIDTSRPARETASGTG